MVYTKNNNKRNILYLKPIIYLLSSTDFKKYIYGLNKYFLLRFRLLYYEKANNIVNVLY